MDLEILHDYLVESKELLEKAQADTLRLEAEPGNEEVLASIFRAFHTIKGGASFLEADNLVAWAHGLEDLLDKLRSRKLPVTSARIDAILKGSDVIDTMFRELGEARLPECGPQGLGAIIKALAAETTEAAASCGEREAKEEVREETGESAGQELVGVCATEESGVTSGAEDAALAPRIAASSGLAAALPDESIHPAKLSPEKLSPEAAEPTEPRLPPAPSTAPSPSKGAEGAETTLRVEASRLDAVMNQVGELVLLRNRLATAVASLGKEDEGMTRIAREMDLAVNDLQSTVMRLRMQPCKRLFQQLPRVIRDVSRQLNKDVEVQIDGEDVEIDKTVVDALAGPMTHLVRNSLDHGIETPDVRVGLNKPPKALLRIAAVHLGDKVRIEVSDDGKGIDRRFVVQKAIDKRVITPEQAAHLSEQDALELIFRPGFSTKEKASDLSGRGVGMDVVKETATRMRGRLSIETQLGKGTRVALEFPLTMAVLPVLYLRVRQEIYALPISTIDSLIDLEEHRVHRFAGRATYRVDDTETVPVVDLGAILQERPLRVGAETVEGVLTEQGLFVVSEVLGNEDSVVKPIDFFTGRNLYQGATISGQGNVVLILDSGALSAAASAAVEGGL